MAMMLNRSIDLIFAANTKFAGHPGSCPGHFDGMTDTAFGTLAFG